MGKYGPEKTPYLYTFHAVHVVLFQKTEKSYQLQLGTSSVEYYMFKVNNRNTNKVWNMLKVNNKDTKTAHC